MLTKLFDPSLPRLKALDGSQILVTDFINDVRRDTPLQVIRDFMSHAAASLPDAKGHQIAGIMGHNRWESIAAIMALMRKGWCVAVLPIVHEKQDLELLLSGNELGLLLRQKEETYSQLVDGQVARFFDHPHGENLVCEINSKQARAVVGFDNPKLVVYTSGSTTFKRGVVFQDEAVASWYCAQQSPGGEGAPAIVSAQIHHITPLISALNTLQDGRRLFLLDRFIPGRLLAAIKEARPHILTGTPTMFRLLLQNLGEKELCGLGFIERLNIYGEFLDPKLRDQLRKIFGNVNLINGYGMTEAGGSILSPFAGPDGLAPDGSCGQISRNDISWKLDPSDTDNRGELLIKSPRLGSGYLNHRAIGKEVFVDGWLRTGDQFSIDENEYFYHEGRIDQQYKAAGQKIYTHILEAELREILPVADLAVTPVETVSGETLTALLIVQDDNVEYSHIISVLSNQKYHNIAKDQVFSVESMPILPSGKVDRRAVKKMAQELYSRLQRKSEANISSIALDKHIAVELTALFSDLLNIANLPADADLVDLGLDSLLATIAIIHADEKKISLSAEQIFGLRNLDKIILDIQAQSVSVEEHCNAD
jgi:long-chain acyl-CoA synthetase